MLGPLLIRTPDFIGAADLAAARAALMEKGKNPLVSEVRLEQITEGRCVQMLHTGPYASEPETIAKMHEFAQSQGLAFTGPHHEIYLSDPHRVPARAPAHDFKDAGQVTPASCRHLRSRVVD